MAAEYVLKEGNEAVILCERGIRTFETAYRFTLDLTAVPGAQGAQPPAGHRRPQPRRGPARPRRAAEPRRRRGRAPTASSSRSTPTPRRPSATARRRCAPRASPPTPRASQAAAAVAGKAAFSRGRLIVAVVGVGAHRRVGRPGRPRAGSARRCAGSTRAPTRRARARRDRRGPPRPRRRARRRRRRVRRRPGRRAGRDRGHGPRAGAARAASSPTSARPSARSSTPARDPRFVGGHPLAGAEAAGVEHAREDLFDGATWYLTPTATTAGHRCSSACTACSPASARGPRSSTPTSTTA